MLQQQRATHKIPEADLFYHFESDNIITCPGFSSRINRYLMTENVKGLLYSTTRIIIDFKIIPARLFG